MAEPAKILFEDDDLFVVDKPSGVPVIPARGEDPAACLKEKLAATRGERIFVVHRLDRVTSGVLVFAKHAEAHRALSDAFERRAVSKRYAALLAGDPGPDAGMIERALADDRRGGVKVVEGDFPGARVSSTAFVVVDRARDADGAALATRVEFAPRTGRRHQLRVHAASLGCPILGDDRYGDARTASLAPRLMLHAIEILLPKTKATARVSARAETPAVFDLVFAGLRGR